MFANSHQKCKKENFGNSLKGPDTIQKSLNGCSSFKILNAGQNVQSYQLEIHPYFQCNDKLKQKIIQERPGGNF